MPLNRVFATAALFAAAAYADVTLRYKTEVKLNPSLPPQITEGATKALATSLPPETVYQWKDGKGAAAFGLFRSVVDIGKQQITIFDPEKKRFATLKPEELMDEMARVFSDMPAEAKAAMASIKANTEFKASGLTTTIQGIQAEEREVQMTIDAPPGPNAPAGPMMKMAIQFWIAKDEDVMKVPALRELKGYNLWALATMNPATSIERMFQQMPGMGEGMTKFVKDVQGTGMILLRSRVTMWMPGIAAMLKQMPPDKSPFGAGFDADAPFMTMSQELAEISAAAIPASVFVVPEGFQSVPASEFVRDMMPKAPNAAK